MAWAVCVRHRPQKSRCIEPFWGEIGGKTQVVSRGTPADIQKNTPAICRYACMLAYAAHTARCGWLCGFAAYAAATFPGNPSFLKFIIVIGVFLRHYFFFL